MHRVQTTYQIESLKQCADHMAPALTIIFQRSIDHGKLPNDWLNANVSCIFKKGDKHAAENNRPVSLTSVPCKLLEYIICGHMMKHLEKHNVLTSLNHVFRSGYSYETQLVVTIHDMLQSFHKGKQVDKGILDFSKAFDTVPHDRLLHKNRSVRNKRTVPHMAHILPNRKENASGT